MTRAHRLLLSLAAVAAAAGSAGADTTCKRYEGTAGTTDRATLWSRRLSLAGCLRTAAPVPQVQDPELVRRLVAGLRARVQRPIAIYRDALRDAPWELRLLAAHELGATYSDLIVRARVAVSPELRDQLELLLAPYKRAAIDAYTQAETLASEVPVGAATDDLVRHLAGTSSAALEAMGLD